jgi:hypothetical protein
MKIEVANGEIVDKVTILYIKLKRIKSPEKLVNIKLEYDLLNESMHEMGIDDSSKQFQALLAVNMRLWDIEDKLRIKESEQQFDQEFIELARSVYFENDIRSEIKKAINMETGSKIIEEKEYVKYR